MKVSTIVLLLSALALSSAIAGCFETEKDDGEDQIDDMGGTVHLDDVPDRIITMSPGLTEIVFLLGAGDAVIACDDASNYPPDVAGIERINSYQSMNLERIVALGPDLVLLDRTLDVSEENYNALKGVGLQVYRIYPTDLNGVIKNIRDLGKIMGRTDAAEALSASLLARIGAVEASAAILDDEERPTVLHVVYYDGTSDPWVMTDTTFSGDLIRMAGGNNAVSDSAGISVQVPLETVIGAGPDIIFTSQSEEWPTPSREAILSDQNWEGIAAVQNGQVIDVNGDLVDRTGPRLVDGLELFHRYVMEF